MITWKNMKDNNFYSGRKFERSSNFSACSTGFCNFIEMFIQSIPKDLP